MVKVRGVKRYCEFQSLSLTANHKVILIPGQLVKCFRTLLQRVHRSLSSPYKRKTPHKRGLSEHFLSALRLRRLEVSLHNPSRKLHKAMPPAHSLTSALRVNTRRCSPYIIIIRNLKGYVNWEVFSLRQRWLRGTLPSGPNSPLKWNDPMWCASQRGVFGSVTSTTM